MGYNPRLYVLISFRMNSEGHCVEMNFKYGKMERGLCLNLQNPDQLVTEVYNDAKEFTKYCMSLVSYDMQEYCEFENDVLARTKSNPEIFGCIKNIVMKATKKDGLDFVAVRWNSL